ncbi:MAG: MFS transporter [Chlamydiia bacterium]|nr:MFS transporter [Chlamydiia bacterium]
MKKMIWLGHFFDRYDQALFAVLAPTLAPLFFPFEDPIYGLIAAFCLVPLGLLSKPVGAYVFGRRGDRIGYHSTLSVSLIGMAFSTAAMGFLPTYQQIGIWAPVLLGVCRLLQNFFSAGGTTGASIVALADAPEKKRTLVSSLIDASGMVGTWFGSAVCAAALYGGISWRWLFLSGLLAGCIGVYVRKTPIVTVAPKKEHAPFRVLWKHKKEIGSIAAATGFSYGNYYLITLFFNGFLPLVGLASTETVLAVNSWMLLFDLCLLPLVGYLVQTRAARDTWMRVSLMASLFLAIPLYLCLDSGWSWIVVRMAFMVLGVFFSAPIHAWALDCAPSEHRYAVKAMGTALGSRFLGAPVPVLALWLYQCTGWVWAPGLIVAALALIALVFMKQLSVAVSFSLARGR